MEGLKNDQLEENEIYTCRLSGKKVMVTSIEEVKTMGRTVIMIDAQMYNPITGRYDAVIVWEYMLKL